MVFHLDEFLNCCFEPTFAIAIPEIPAPTIKTSRSCLETFFFDLKVKGRAGSSIIRPMTIPTSSQNCRMIRTQLLNLQKVCPSRFGKWTQSERQRFNISKTPLAKCLASLFQTRRPLTNMVVVIVKGWLRPARRRWRRHFALLPHG